MITLFDIFMATAIILGIAITWLIGEIIIVVRNFGKFINKEDCKIKFEHDSYVFPKENLWKIFNDNTSENTAFNLMVEQYAKNCDACPLVYYCGGKDKPAQCKERIRNHFKREAERIDDGRTRKTY